MEPRFGHDFSRVRAYAPRLSFRPQPASLGEVVEEVGWSACDTDAGKVTWGVDVKKIPLCMADCAAAHEKAHVKFMQAECAKVSAAIKASEAANKKAGESKSEADLKKAEQALKDAEKATAAYEKWMTDNCRANEEQAYQAGIDACKSDKVVKECAGLKETDQYTKIMKQWETFKKKPPDCPEPPKESEKGKAGESKKEAPKKSPESEKPPTK
jgi:hypothetical protein